MPPSRKVADLACGTGTLLRAAYQRICSFHERAGATNESLRRLHRTAMERGLIGTDVSPIAAHLTASSLAMIGFGEAYGETQIGWLQTGGPHGRTGSLEYLERPVLQDLFDEVAGKSHGKTVNSDESHSVTVIDQSVDWVLMNPPYSRTRGGQSAFDIAGLSKEERFACQDRWRKLTRDRPANNQAGMAPSFIVLAAQKVKRGGRIGFVLPLTAAIAESWTVTRRMIQEWFTEITVVGISAGKAIGGNALSADTHMEEMLLVATRRTDDEMVDPPSPIRCVTLEAPPVRTGQAGEIARIITAATRALPEELETYPLHAGEEEIGSCLLFVPDKPGDPWWPLGLTHPDLAKAIDGLLQGTLIGLCDRQTLGPMTTIEGLFGRIGPTHDRLGHPKNGDGRGAFEMQRLKRARDAIGPDRSLWAADSRTQRGLVVLPTHRGVAHTGASNQKREEMRSTSSTLFYARGMRWTSQRLLAATTEQSCMGGRAWVSLCHTDADLRKAFALWANSTLGMVIHWARGQRTQPGRSTTQIKAVKKIPCPDFLSLPSGRLRAAARRFDSLSQLELQRARCAHTDANRHAIDRAVMEMFGLPESTHGYFDNLRQLWCSEPSVKGK